MQNSKTVRATPTWEKRAERGVKVRQGSVKRQRTKSAERLAIREYGQYDA